MKICIIGNDVHAVVARWMARARGHQVFFHHTQAPNLRRPCVIHESPLFLRMLEELQVNYSQYRINSGILLQDEVYSYPREFRGLGVKRCNSARAAIWKKTRLAEATPKPWETIDYDSATTKVGLQFVWSEFINKIYGQRDFGISPMIHLEPDRIVFSNGASAPFDLCLISLPLWRIQEIVSWSVPSASAIALNTAVVESNQVDDARDRMSGWDFVWTPYTPDEVVHRVFHIGDEYHVQFSGSWPEGEPHAGLLGDLNYLFPDGWAPIGSHRGEPGFFCPISERPTWPSTVQPLGRLAKWDSRATLGKTIEDVSRIL